MPSYVYLVTNIINQKIYIGKTNNKNVRWSQHKSKSKKFRGLFLNAIRKYGYTNFNFEIIKECNTEDEAYEYERVLVELFNTRNRKIGYNVAEGGGGGSKGYKVKDKIKLYFKNKYTGSKSIRAKFTDNDIIQILTEYSTGNYTTYYLANKYNCGKSTIIRIINGTVYSNVNFDRTNFKLIGNDNRYKNMPRGELSKACKLSDDNVNNIRKLYLTNNYSYQKLADMFNVSKQNIYFIIKNKSRKNILI